MLTLDTLERISLTSRPLGQMVVGSIIRANFRFPPTKTRVVVEGLDRLPRDGRIYIAMNHPDRYNYWPFQVELWRRRDEFTATWVKGKYFNNTVMEYFMVATNNIPAPSKGYVITVDATQVLGHPPSTELYRVLRHALDGHASFDEVRAEAEDVGVARDFDVLQGTPREILGLPYHPAHETFVDAQREVFSAMMSRFVDLNFEAFDRGLRIVVMPEGTRSRRLSTGRPGLAQMAVRTRATIVPVGCNNSDLAYPGNSPFSRGGEITYRVGEPLTPEGDLAPFQVDEEFQPFTAQANPYDEKFEGLTDLLMDRIDGLLDDRHRASENAETLVDGARRFL